MSFAPQKKEGGWGGGATHHTESWMKNRNLLWQKRLIGSCRGRRWVAISQAVWQPFSLWRRRPMIRGPPDRPHNESPDRSVFFDMLLIDYSEKISRIDAAKFCICLLDVNPVPQEHTGSVILAQHQKVKAFSLLCIHRRISVDYAWLEHVPARRANRTGVWLIREK